MNREDDLFVEAAEAFEDSPEPLRHGVGLAMHGRDDVGTRLEVERVEDVRPSRGEGSELERRVEHHVADDLAPARDALGRERLRRVLVRGEEKLRQPVDLDAVPSPRASSGRRCAARLDVSLPDAAVVGRERAASVEFVSPKTSTPVRALGAIALRIRPASAPCRRCADRAGSGAPGAQLVEEDLRQLGS
jgi:hypothetical protein